MCCPNTDPASFQSLLESDGDLTSQHYVVTFKADTRINCLRTIAEIEDALEPDLPDRNWIWIEGAPVFDSPITVHYAYSPALDRNYNSRIATINSDLRDKGFEPQQFNFDKFPKRLSGVDTWNQLKTMVVVQLIDVPHATYTICHLNI